MWQVFLGTCFLSQFAIWVHHPCLVEVSLLIQCVCSSRSYFQAQSPQTPSLRDCKLKNLEPPLDKGNIPRLLLDLVGQDTRCCRPAARQQELQVHGKTRKGCAKLARGVKTLETRMVLLRLPISSSQTYTQYSGNQWITSSWKGMQRLRQAGKRLQNF